MLQVRCSDAQVAMLKRAAQRRGTTVSGFVRRAALDAAEATNAVARRTLVGRSKGK
jgi:uncharacterized protein (DUF1778 family)